MAPELYSVDQVAERLGLHVRTVRAYVREGRLKAVRVGKQYRIAAADLEAMTGLPAESFEPKPVPRNRFVDVSSIVDIDAISPDLASRITNGLLGAAKSPQPREHPLKIESLYNETRAHLKLILNGSVADTTLLLRLVNVYLEGDK